MTTRSDSDERLPQDPQTSRNGFSQDSLKVVSLPPLEKDSVGEMMTSSKKQVKSPPLASVLEKEDEPILSDSDEASFSKEPEAMDVDCHGVVSVPETTSAFLEETSTANVSEVVPKMEGVVEADESVVCVSDVKESLNLETEKRRLLDEVETVTIFKKKDDVGTASDVHVVEKNGNQPLKMERVRVKDNAFVGRSVKIDLVDDTALLNVVPFSKKAKDPKDAPRKHKKHIGGGGKQQDKGNATNAVEGNELRRIVYSINQMKSMRYAHPADQKKLWSDVYARLLPELVNEYEGLVSLKNQRTAKSNMRESGIGILGTVSAVPRRNRVNIFVH